MLLNKKYNKIADSEKFNNYDNFYAIYVDTKLIEHTKEKYSNYQKISITYEKSFLINIFITKFELSKGSYKIIYGHFYEDENVFLYKNISERSVIGHSVKKCLRDKLYFNKNNNLLCSNIYDIVKTQLKYIYIRERDSIGGNIDQYELNCDYYNETVDISNIFVVDDNKGCNYENECLKIYQIV